MTGGRGQAPGRAGTQQGATGLDGQVWVTDREGGATGGRGSMRDGRAGNRTGPGGGGQSGRRDRVGRVGLGHRPGGLRHGRSGAGTSERGPQTWPATLPGAFSSGGETSLRRSRTSLAEVPRAVARSVGEEPGTQARAGEAARSLGGWPASRDTAVSSTALADVVADVPFSDNVTAFSWQTFADFKII